jgi:hypothetical protein
MMQRIHGWKLARFLIGLGVLMTLTAGAATAAADGATSSDETKSADRAKSAQARRYVVVNLNQGFVKDEVFERLRSLRPEQAGEGVDIGAAAIFSYFRAPHEEVAGRLKRFLQLAAKHEIPIVVQLDGEQWWSNRPDLWNWWDPDRPACRLARWRGGGLRGVHWKRGVWTARASVCVVAHGLSEPGLEPLEAVND